MKSEDEIKEEVVRLGDKIKLMKAYSRLKDSLDDRHGVCDAQMDLRDLDAEKSALLWVLS